MFVSAVVALWLLLMFASMIVDVVVDCAALVVVHAVVVVSIIAVSVCCL